MHDTDTTEAANRPMLASTGGPTASPSEVAQAFTHADDRSERLDHVLGQLEEVVTRLGLVLEPVLTNGQPYPNPPADPSPTTGRLPDDARSQVTRRVHGLAERYDRAADYVAEQTSRLHRTIEALEV